MNSQIGLKPGQIGSLVLVLCPLDRFVEILEHTETPEHTGNYPNTLKKVFCFYK